MLKDRLVRWLSRPTPDRGINEVIGTSVILDTDVGLVRDENQDRVALMRLTTKTGKPFVVMALVDGMGGMRNGAECATLALSAFFNALNRFRLESPRKRLELAANITNMEVHEFSQGGGGATLSALLVSADQQDTLALNVGDSRIYATVDEDDESKVIRLTVDDSLEEAVGGHGKELLQFIGMGEGLIPHIREVPQNAKRLLITSDGIHFIRHETLCDVLLDAQGPTQIAEQLRTLARWRGAPDNASLAIAILPELVHSFPSIEDTGIEIWDPFDALHIIWIKQEHVDSPALAKSSDSIATDNLATKKVRSPGNASAKAKASPPKNSSAKTKTKAKTKAKKKSSEPVATEPIATPQLIFEINSEVNKGEDK